MSHDTIHDAGDRRISLVSALNVGIGAWLMVAPIVLGYDNDTGAATWNDVTVGLLVLSLATARAVAPRRAVVLSWFHVAVGVWLLASPLLFGYADVPRALVNDVAAGAGLAVLAVISAVGSHVKRR